MKLLGFCVMKFILPFALFSLASADGHADPEQTAKWSDAAATESLKAADSLAKMADMALQKAKTYAGKAREEGDLASAAKKEVEPTVEAAQKALTEAEQDEVAAQDLLEGVEEKSYEAAKVTAEKEVARVEEESQAYFKAVLEDLRAAVLPPRDEAARNKAAAEAEAPYLEAKKKVEAFATTYNNLAQEIANEVIDDTSKAEELAKMAVQEQTLGSTERANKHMVEAHKLLYAAREKRERAKKVHGLAERINGYVPQYQEAGNIAASNAAVAFSGLQLSSRSFLVRGRHH